MKVMLFGGTGMVGQGALRECLLDPSIKEVVAITRSTVAQPIPTPSPKLRQIIRKDLFDLDGLDDEFAAVDTCMFCLGVTSFRMKEDDYRHITYDLTLSVAKRFVRVNPKVVFIYVSGAGTDSTGESKTMWARVKGETENDLLALPLRAAFMFRPGGIVPQHGIKSKTAVYQVFYSILKPIMPLFERFFPKYVTTTDQLGGAMLRLAKKGVAQEGPPRRVLESVDIARM
ncbi:Rossmann-fold NAD(P)-binding domain-containing protein [Granulicella tundricola]|uniref:Epimerase n=1 Tax=Granulicella tundricola (strain ATCC BAA-1859 / DSM 23138 / MP5ACTX9) TaxID=1198114 RepID=E8X447_GRATM|nr:epimerase [Granulicella tundricola]ADW67107.1 hypothetical protein AciX9_0016 [Granulicella tundricola MP5ACTX9]